MPVAILGTDGNPMTSRDVDGSDNNFITIAGTMKLSGSYVTGGDTIDWTTIGSFLSSTVCLQVSIWSQGGNLVNSFAPIGGPATALKSWLLKISAASTFGTEFSAGAYSAALLADTLAFTALFRKLL